METHTDYTLPAVKPEEPDEILIMVATLDQGMLDNDLVSTAQVAQIVGLFRSWLINRRIPFEDGRVFWIDQVDHYTDMTIRAHARQAKALPPGEVPIQIELALMPFGHADPSGVFLSRTMAEPYARALEGKLTRYQGHDYTIKHTWLDAGERGNIWGACERVNSV